MRDRRDLCRSAMRVTLGALGLLVAPGARGQQSGPHRLVHTYIYGGLTQFWGCDPPVAGEKATSDGFEGNYRTQAAVTVSGKGNLVVGEGLAPAADAFARMNTCFVNGVDAGQVIHFIGRHYALTGVLSFSATREAPALAAVLGEKLGAFPPHLALGLGIPLGDTAYTKPPLFTTGSIADSLSPPFSDAAAARVAATLAQLDDLYFASLSPTELAALESWRAIGRELVAFDAKDMATRMTLPPAQVERYGSDGGWALVLQALSENLCSFVTTTGAVPDSHYDESAQLQAQKEAMQGFNLFVEDLRSTPDPDDSTQTLADTTTIIINSEFGRSPLYNAAGGTDHWPATSVILMGKGVRDNCVVGATDGAGNALGWAEGAATEKTDDTTIKLEHIFARILADFGLTSEADTMSLRRLDDAFT